MSRRSIDSTQFSLQPDRVIDLPESGPVGDVTERIEMQADTPRLGAKLDELEFMNELVDVRIIETGNPADEHVVELRNDGVPQFIIRGQWQRVKRKFVEVLARAKKDSIATPEFEDSTGARSTRILKTASLQYPFEMRDQNPKGYPWLQGILSEG